MEVKILLNQRKGVKMPNVGEEQIQPQDSLKEKKKKTCIYFHFTCYSRSHQYPANVRDGVGLTFC